MAGVLLAAAAAPTASSIAYTAASSAATAAHIAAAHHQPKKRIFKNPDRNIDTSVAGAAGTIGAAAPRRDRETTRAAYVTAMSTFWEDALNGTRASMFDTKSLKPCVPLSRVRKIMKTDEDVRSVVVRARAERTVEGARG
jgi:hypothetical protein